MISYWKNFRNLSSLLRNLTYLSFLNSFLFLSRFSVSLKSLDNYFFRWFAYKSLLSRFSVLISYNVWSSNHFSLSSRFPCFSRSTFFTVQIFQGLGFSGSRFSGSGSRVQVQCPRSGSRVRVQVLEVAWATWTRTLDPNPGHWTRTLYVHPENLDPGKPGP